MPSGGYGMIYETIWESSVAQDWEAVLVFMALVSIADAEDNVYMNPDRLHRKTNIPMEIITKGLEILLRPDHYSKSRVAGGRRITFLPLVGTEEEPSLEGICRGWHIVNRAYYKRLLRKRYNSAYVARKRAEARSRAGEEARS